MIKIRAGVIRTLLIGLNKDKTLFPPERFNLYIISRIVAFLRDNKPHFWMKCCTQKPTLREAIIVATLYFSWNRQFSISELLLVGELSNPRAVLLGAMTGLDGDAEKHMRKVLSLPPSISSGE